MLFNAGGILTKAESILCQGKHTNRNPYTLQASVFF
jgi:hypothetical protein